MLIKSARFALRELSLLDHAAVIRFANDPAINRHLGFGSIATESGARDYIQKAIAASRQTGQRHSYKLAMCLLDANEMSGSCWLDMEDPDSENASIGYFVESQNWGKGFATEMLQILLQFGFGKLQLHRIYANCDAENPATRRVLEKVGMRQEGLLREHCRRSYGFADMCFYGILRSEWENSSVI